MQMAAKKTGSVLYFEPLRVELNDCFGALKDVTPDAVYSNRRGLDENRGSHDEEDMGASGDPQAHTMKLFLPAVKRKNQKVICFNNQFFINYLLNISKLNSEHK